MEIKKSELHHALMMVKPGLANKEIIEQTTSFAFAEGRVTTYNDSICISHPVPSLDFTGAIKAEELYQILTKIKRDEMRISRKENEIIFNFGKSKVGITIEDELKLPLDEITMPSKWKKLSEDFIEVLSLAYPCASSDASEPVINHVHVTDSMVYATDRYSAIKVALKHSYQEMLIPASIISLLETMNPTKYAVSAGWLHFTNVEGTILSCRTICDAFPNTAVFFNVSDGLNVPLPATLPQMIDRCFVFSKRDTFMDESVSIEIKDNEFILSAKNDNGWIDDFAKCDYSDAPVSFSISPTLLKKMAGKTGSLLLGKKVALFSGEGWQYVVALREQ